MPSKRPGFLAAVLILLALLCLACGLGDKLKEQAAEDIFEKAMEEAGAEGDVELDIGDEIDISDLPEWLSYPNAKATGKMTLAQEGNEGTMYVLETADDIATVATWYKTALSTWEQSASFETAESTQLVYSDGAGQAVQLTLATEGEATAISCWYAKAEVAAEAATPKVAPEKLPGPGLKKMGPGQKGIKGKKVKGR
jgi:uncharacterized protein YuzE